MLDHTWKYIKVFYTFVKYGDKTCKDIIDRGSCINVISNDAMTTTQT